ncbi:MAG: tyrosine-type recombinase/integrase [Anaerolineaceae bacterium]|nr:tyrosine-type recombinase/integrase [Anaerolineaceae bacterium]
MNRRPPGSKSPSRRSKGLSTGTAVDGFLQYKTAEGLSPRTIESYRHDLKLWLEYQRDVETSRITTQDITHYLTYLRTEYRPRRITGGNDRGLSTKTIRNHWVTLSAFFHWAADEFGIHDPMDTLPAPKFTEAPVEPFSKENIEALLKACDHCLEADTNRRKKFTMRRATSFRDRAIILTLVDTGLRASELCSLRVADLDPKTGKLQVRHGVYGGAKGGKGRTVYLGKVARKAIWRYLVDREDGQDPETPLFIGKYGRPFNRDALRQVINWLGERAGVKKSHPHRFRHTFAITYLRSGGDVFTLQSLLGHSTLDMVQHYSRLADIDVEEAHRKASPADNWHL